MQHWLVDAGAIKTGGGVQIALNRLPQLTQALLNNGYRLSLLLPSEGPLVDLNLDHRIEILRSPNRWLARILFEYIHLPAWMKSNNLNGIYTVFGFGLPHPKQVTSLVSTANATTCYPDSIYWKRLSGITKIKRRIYTFLRQSRLKKADHWIFETEIMRNRSVDHLQLPADNTHTLSPSPTSFILDQPARTYDHLNNFNITLLTGSESHKNLDSFIRLCSALTKINITNIQFNITLTKDQLIALAPKNIDLNLIHSINYLGKIPQNQLQDIYSKTDLIMNLSELESFSNNYMEAWKAGLAQICSDRDFSRHICEESALYVEPFNPESAATLIVDLLKDPQKLNGLAQNGKKQLAQLTTQEDYTARTLSLINEIGVLKIQSESETIDTTEFQKS